MRKRYYSVLNHGSSSAKTNDGKEVFLIRTDPNGKPEVSLISLEDPVEGDTNGLRDALNSSISGLKLNEEFDRKKREIGMCSDGATVNFLLYELSKTDIGEYYLHVWCPAHLLELGVQNSFMISSMNAECEQFCINIYHLFEELHLDGVSLRHKLISWELIRSISALQG